MATETLTVPARVANPKRRHSAGTTYTIIDANKKRINSIDVASVYRRNKSTLPSVPEDEQLKAEAIKRNSQRPSRLSRAFSWSTNWNFAGESTNSTTTFTGDAPPTVEERRLSRLGRRLSSISTYATTVAEFIATEPSHETNFPKGLEFPTEGGFKVHLSIYGTVDALEATTMRLLMPRGSKKADFTGAKDYVNALEHICKLKNGDMLCRPPREIEKQNPGAAVILRGTVQDSVFKCFVVGTFPMGLLFEGKEEMPGTYEMEAVIF